MPVLTNAKHEKFAQEIAKGKSADDAFASAAYKPNPGNAQRMKCSEVIKARVAEIMSRGAERAAISVERIVQEFSDIALCDVTEGIQIKNGKVYITDTDVLTPAFKRSISGIKQTKDGVEVKFYDKTSALNSLGKHAGMFKENVNLNVSLSLADLVAASLTKPEAE